MLIHAEQIWNHTGFRLERGGIYSFRAQGTWIDWFLRHDPDGDPTGWYILLKPFESSRRRPKDKWFALIGAIGEDESSTFLIGSSNPRFVAPASGELTCYANDVNTAGAYRNNKGFITLEAQRIG